MEKSLLLKVLANFIFIVFVSAELLTDLKTYRTYSTSPCVVEFYNHSKLVPKNFTCKDMECPDRRYFLKECCETLKCDPKNITKEPAPTNPVYDVGYLSVWIVVIMIVAALVMLLFGIVYMWSISRANYQHLINEPTETLPEAADEELCSCTSTSVPQDDPALA